VGYCLLSVSLDRSTRRLGPYKLIAGLGRGGQAEVFLAVKHGPAGFSKLLVVKRIRPDLEHDVRSREALVAEARLAARLQHPNVVQTLEVGDEEGQLYIAMEFLDGQPLSQLVRAALASGRDLPLPIAAAVLSDMLAGLHAAHELRDYDGKPLGVIHRDVSPQNVFLTYQGEVKLVDFGVAKAATGEVTQTGIVKGKPAYMAPEQAMGRPLDRRADVYAAGVIGWELLAGRRLFHGDSLPGIAAQQQEGPPKLAVASPRVPAALAKVIDRALSLEPDKRFSTAGEMRDALESALAEAGLQKAPRDEVGALLESYFSRDRALLQEQIRQSLAASEGATGGQPTRKMLPRLGQDEIQTSNERPAPPPGPKRLLRPVLGSLVLLAAAIAAGLLLRPAPPPIALRLCGSRTIGNALAGALVEGFLRQRGLPSIERVGDQGKLTLTAGKLGISIEAAGSSAAFKDLFSGACDVGMASRQMSAEEARSAGDLRKPNTEHVIALDAIAVLVHPSNPVHTLGLDQVRAIFAGDLKDWSQVGGQPGPIEVVALDENSTTWDTFKNLTLGGRELPPGTQRFDDSARLSDHVSTSPRAIGFAGLSFVRNAGVVATSQPGFDPTLPSPFTVASEVYPFYRRLYLYTLGLPRTPLATDFVDFVLSGEGQQIVQRSGFVDLSIALRSPQPCDARCPESYQQVTQGARRLTLDLRFRENGALDSRAVRDLDRLVAFLRGFPAAKVMLLGFEGTIEASLSRAKVAAAELQRRGVQAEVVQGFGDALPVWPAGDEAGRQRNRRIEVWIR
jgi:phosphate transport system substrate-binding protein